MKRHEAKLFGDHRVRTVWDDEAEEWLIIDVAAPEQMFRVVQSVPSPKAEPFNVWMAKVAAERIDQLQDPERSMTDDCNRWQSNRRQSTAIEKRCYDRDTQELNRLQAA